MRTEVCLEGLKENHSEYIVVDNIKMCLTAIGSKRCGLDSSGLVAGSCENSN
jgi:hypothetical protein